MFERLEAGIRKYIDFSEEEMAELKRYFIPKKVRKRQLLFEAGDVCSRIAFVEKGGLFSYAMDEKGNSHVVQFAFEGWWMADLYSFFTGETSKISIEALEDSELLLINKEQHEQLLTRIPKYESYMRILYQNAYVAMQRRIEETNGLTAEEKYSRFLTHYSFILNRVPQHLIASYLGITPETLSRIRKQLFQ